MLIPVRHFNQLSLKACDLISSQNQLWHFVSPLPLLSTSECSICFFSKSSRRFLLIKHVFSLCITPAYFCLWLILIDSLSIYGGNIQKRGNSIKAFLHLCTLVFLRQICCMQRAVCNRNIIFSTSVFSSLQPLRQINTLILVGAVSAVIDTF